MEFDWTLHLPRCFTVPYSVAVTARGISIKKVPPSGERCRRCRHFKVWTDAKHKGESSTQLFEIQR
jgi:hypothetical protein